MRSLARTVTGSCFFFLIISLRAFFSFLRRLLFFDGENGTLREELMKRINEAMEISQAMETLQNAAGDSRLPLVREKWYRTKMARAIRFGRGNIDILVVCGKVSQSGEKERKR